MFLSNMTTAAQQVLILYLIVAVGFVADRLHVFGQDTAKRSNDLLFYIVTPMVIVQSFMNMEFDKSTAGAFLKAFLIMTATIVVANLLAIPFFNKNKDHRAIFKYAVGYGNMGYMALPLCESMLGSEGVFYCSAGVVAFNIFSFTHGIWVMTRDKGKASFDFKKLLFNPGVISVIIGLPLFITGVDLPDVVDSAVGYVASLNTPLAMIFFGTYIANTDLKTMFKVKENYIVAALKLIAVPAIMLGAFKIFGLAGTMITACIISAAVPSANNTVMFSAKYGNDTGVASKVVTFNSVLSVLTIPVMVALSKMI